MLILAQSIEDLESHRELLPLNMKCVTIERAAEYDSSDESDSDDEFKVGFKRSSTKVSMFEMSSDNIKALKSQELDEISLSIPFTIVKKHEDKDIEVFGKIKFIHGNWVYFKTRFDFRRESFIAESVTFEYNRISTRASLKALASIGTPLRQYLSEFETLPPVSVEKYEKFYSSEFTDGDFVWFNNRVEGNKEQSTAIKSIVNCVAYPFPYIIFGPPGKK